VKVNVAQAVSGQVAGPSDLMSLLTGDEHASFASLLDLGGSEPGAAHRVDESQWKQGIRPKEKDSNKDQPSPSADLGPSSTTSLPALRVLSNVGITPWAIQSGDFGASGDAGHTPLLPADPKATADSLAASTRPSAISNRTTDASALSQQRGLEQNTAEMPPIDNLFDSKLVEPLNDRAIVANQDEAVTHGDKVMVSIIPQSPAATASTVQSSTVTVDNNLPALMEQSGRNPGPVAVPIVQGYTTPIREVNSYSEGQNPAVTSPERLGDLPPRSVGGQVSPSAPLRGVVDMASASVAGSHSQGNGSDAHRGSPDAKEVVGDALVPNTPQAGTFGGVNPGDSLHGQPGPMNSTHLGPAHESVPSAQLKAPSSPAIEDSSAARLLGSTLRGDLRMGVQTEAFGRVTIQTSAQGGQLSAQLSLENAKESAVLAAHLPMVEQKIAQQHGLNASVRLVGGHDGGAGAGSTGRDQSGSDRKDPQRYHNKVMARPGGIDQGFSSEGRGVEPALLGGKYSVSSRLDVTV
jgi:hypothetical protein